MKKDFKTWHIKKEKLNDADANAFFQEREVWWCLLGVNVGHEQDGGQRDFERPVVILKKFNLDVCLVIPLTARPKKGIYYFPVGTIEERNAVAVLSQVRLIDRRRLVNKICTLEENIFRALAQDFMKKCLPSTDLK